MKKRLFVLSENQRSAGWRKRVPPGRLLRACRVGRRAEKIWQRLTAPGASGWRLGGLLVCAVMLLFTGCSPDEPQDAGTVQAEKTVQVAVFVPDAQAEYLTGVYADVPKKDSLPEMLLDGLAAKGAIPDEVTLLDCQTEEGLSLDLSEAFLDVMSSSGSAGEAMVLYAVVDTFLFNYPEAGPLTLTVAGKAIETEHGLYEEPFAEMEYLRE